jgi:DNA repair photolyase
MAVAYREYECKSMLRFHKYVDNWFWGDASLSPYRACEHACNYCDGRSERYHASEDFDSVVMVKKNAPEVLKIELDKLYPKQRTLGEFTGESFKERRPRPVIMVSSGVSDAYQPVEIKYELTKCLLELLRDYSMPTYVMTKSDLILRDLDILKDINERSWCNVSFSFSAVDRDIAQLFEPKASLPEKRLQAMKTIADEDILTGATCIPVIPYITDSDEQMENTIEAVKEHSGKYVLVGTMTMRDTQARRFYEVLEEHFPELVDKYKKLYWRGYEPDGKYIGKLYARAKALCKKHGISNSIPRFIPDVELKKNIEISTMLFRIAYFLGFHGGNRHVARFYQRIAQTIEDMDEDIIELHDDDKLDDIPGMSRNLKELIIEYIKTGRCKYLEELSA